MLNIYEPESKTVIQKAELRRQMVGWDERLEKENDEMILYIRERCNYMLELREYDRDNSKLSTDCE